MELNYIKANEDNAHIYIDMLEDPLTMSFNKELVKLDADRWLKSLKLDNNYFRYIKIDDTIVGIISFLGIDLTAIVSVIINYKYRNKGYGYKAFSDLIDIVFKKGYKEAIDYVRVDNKAAIDMLKRYGFTNIKKDILNTYKCTLTKKEYDKIKASNK